MQEFDHLAQRIEALRNSLHMAGVAVAVIHDAQIVYCNASGNHADVQLTSDTPFEVASLSKPVFAYAVLKLCERGVLDLDAPLTDYLPELYVPDEPYLPLITARHALSHTTGFPNWRDESGLRAAFQPGSAFNYSTEGLIYLQTVIEHLLGQSIHQYMKIHVLEPFGMYASEFLPVDMSPFPAYLPRHLYSFGAVSLRTTVSDYARFLIEMMQVGREDEFRLSEASITTMLSPHIPVGDQAGLSWGLGWGLQHKAGEEDSFWHWGQRLSRTRNFAIGLRHLRAGVVIMTHSSDGLTMCEPIVQIVMGYSDESPAFQWLLPAEQWRADGRKLA
jgi:CubicO group peptidase (beta-lactamase class C family)